METKQSTQINKLKITSPFWKRYRKLMADDSIPFQWDMINDNNDVEVENSAIATGRQGKRNQLQLSARRN